MKNFEEPIFEFILFNIDDVIATSGSDCEDGMSYSGHKCEGMKVNCPSMFSSNT